MNTSSFSIGPFFTRLQQETSDRGLVAPLGAQIEWASPETAAQIPVFQLRCTDGREQLTLERVVVESRQIPFEAECSRCDLIETSSGTFVPLESLLVGLYRRHSVCRSIFHVLTEFGALAPLEHPGRPLSANLGLLIPEAEHQGFVLSTVVADERAVYAELGWRPSQQDYVFHTCICAFNRTSIATLGAGQWTPAGKVGVGQLLAQELRRGFPGPPSGLLTEAGLERLQNRIRPHPPTTCLR